ncbi:MAG TPA: PIG-L family deacetylase [Verrucomicrobiae bacterium]
MKLFQPTAEIYVPDGKPVKTALRRVTHLGIGAHQDDLEFMAFHGILAGRQSRQPAFGGITCTNGAGSARSGKYKKFTDEQMMAVRRREQNRAAKLGRYSVMVQLDHPSKIVKSPTETGLRTDLQTLIAATRAQVIYTHNPADKHDTHIGVTVAVIEALRQLPTKNQPRQVIGCEVWRDLDWVVDAQKVVMDVSGQPKLAARLNGVFDSQIAGGKRYDLATLGRRSANATFFESHATDAATQVIFGLDLTPLIQDPTKDLVDFTLSYVDSLRADIQTRLQRRLGRG